MKRAITVAMVVALTLGLSGCDALFEMNLFDAVGKAPPPTSDPSTLKAADIAELAQSPAFFEYLADDPALRDKYVAQLESLRTSATTDTALAQAVVLETSVRLNTTAAGETIANVVNKIDTLKDSFNDMPKLIEEIVPPELLTDEKKFKEAINAFISSADAFTALAGKPYDSIPGDTDKGTLLVSGIASLAIGILDDANPTINLADVLWSAVGPDQITPTLNAPTDMLKDPTLEAFMTTMKFTLPSPPPANP